MEAFYPWLACLFYSSTSSVCRDRFFASLLLLRIRSEVEEIVDWMSQILFAAEIVFRRLDRYMPKQELNLLQLTTAIMAELRTGSSQIMRCDML